MLSLDAIFEQSMPVTESGCWIWMRGINGRGYPSIRRETRGSRKTNYTVHRIAWAAANGPIPDGMSVCHRCDIPACVNPDHLFIGTHADNMGDKGAKGRASRGEKHTEAALTSVSVQEIRASSEPARILAERYGVSLTTIWNARTGETWKHLPMPTVLPRKLLYGAAKQPPAAQPPKLKPWKRPRLVLLKQRWRKPRLQLLWEAA